MKMKYLGFLLIFLSSSVVFAGDYASLRFVGFSKDGQYMAFEESGEWDVHSGGDYANTYFIDVEKNAYAIPPITYDWSENMDRHTGRYSQNATLVRYISSRCCSDEAVQDRDGEHRPACGCSSDKRSQL